MYGWGKNAPPVHLPNGTGFSVGPGTGTRSVVLQVHYLKLRPPGDSSGVRLRLTSAPVPYSAGLVAYASGFSVPPRKNSTLVPNECCYSGFEPLHGFAFRVHTHALGRRVFLDHTPAAAGRGRGKGKAVRALEQDPQLPQGFYPADPVVTIHPGDKLQATCDFNSAHMVSAGYFPLVVCFIASLHAGLWFCTSSNMLALGAATAPGFLASRRNPHAVDY